MRRLGVLTLGVNEEKLERIDLSLIDWPSSLFHRVKIDGASRLLSYSDTVPNIYIYIFILYIYTKLAA